MSENKFKTIVNAAVTERTLKHLNKIANGHSKHKILVKEKSIWMTQDFKEVMLSYSSVLGQGCWTSR